MGYRSEVQALVYPLGGEHNLVEYEKLKLLMNTTFKDVYDAWEEDFTWDDHHRVLKFVAYDVKWYESYTEVALFSPFLDEVHKLGYEYEFIRIGEDDNDNEAMNSENAEYFLRIQRTIESSI
jgi:hypothetical protein